MTRGRLDAQVTVPTGGWDAAVTGTASGTATVAAGNYYASTFFTALAAALSSTTGNTVTVTASDGESGTGIVTIASSANIAITWTDTDQRDYLGFTGNLTAATSHAGTEVCESLWLPNAEIASAYGNDDEGHTETDLGSTESPRGDVKALVYNTRQVLPWLRWSHVPKRYARIAGETTANESFERWWRNTQGGEKSYFAPLSAFRVYWDAATSTNKTYRAGSRRGTDMPRPVDEWAGLYTIEFSRLVRVPGT